MSERPGQLSEGVGREAGHVPERIREFLRPLPIDGIPELNQHLAPIPADDFRKWERELREPEGQAMNAHELAIETKNAVKSLIGILKDYFDSDQSFETRESEEAVTQFFELEAGIDGLREAFKLDDAKVVVSRSRDRSVQPGETAEYHYTLEFAEDADRKLVFLDPEQTYVHEWWVKRGDDGRLIERDNVTRESVTEDVSQLKLLTELIRRRRVHHTEGPDA